MRLVLLALLLLTACASPAPVTEAASAPPQRPRFDERTLCADAPDDSPICVGDASGATEAQARAALGEREIVFVRDGDWLNFYARGDGDQMRVCCSLQTPMVRIAESEFYAARYRLSRLDEATLSFMPPSVFRGVAHNVTDALRYVGPEAPPSPARVETLQGQVLERTLHSDALEETRKLYIYLPPNYDRARTYPVIYLTDGSSASLHAPYVEQLIIDRRVVPLIIIGSESGQEGIVEDRSSLGIEDLRSADYLPGYEEGGDRFERHLRFFAEELVVYAEHEFNASPDRTQRVVAGFSNGASFSVYAALRRPDVFGISIPISPGWRRLTEAEFNQPLRARFFISAGLYEINRARSAEGYFAALRTHGYEAVVKYPVMGHDSEQEVAMVAHYLPMVFPAPSP